MTNQEKKRWLLRYTMLDKEINRQLEELERLKAMCQKMTSTLSEVPISAKGKASSREELYTCLADLMDEINGKVDQYAAMRGEIETAINTVDKPTLRFLLKRKYIDGKTWEEIAVELNKSWRHTVRLHGEALEKINIFSPRH